MDLNKYKFGFDYQKSATTFTVYALFVDKIEVVLYYDAGSYREETYPLEKIDDDIYRVTIEGDLAGRFYRYRLVRGKHAYECSDPYALASSPANKRSYICDIYELKSKVDFPKNYRSKAQNQAIIYETHMRDFTVKAEIEHKGKYLGAVEGEAENDRLEYLKELGITHLHFLPLQKTATLRPEHEKIYNWGYDPEQYFVPEAVYASDPESAESPIIDILTMVATMHKKGVNVILDVVYNHTYDSSWHAFEILAPNVYYRRNPDGSFSNGSGCGNELNTEHPVVRKMILDSLKHWQDFYEFDGFRFDLMALIDVQTIEEVAKLLRQDKPETVIYGEPWTGGGTTLAFENQMLKGKQIGKNVALFNDEYRNALKGDSDGTERGYVTGEMKNINQVRLGLIGSVDYDQYNLGFTRDPFETINYISAHDNLILDDKLIKAGFNEPMQRKQITKLSLAMVIMAFGIPFIQAGTEFMQTKQMDHNSYKSGDMINALNWELRKENQDLVEWVKTIIKLRQAMPCYQEYNQEDIRANVKLLVHDKLVGMQIQQKNYNYKYVLVIANGSFEELEIELNLSDKTQALAVSSVREIETADKLLLKGSEFIVIAQDEPFLK